MHSVIEEYVSLAERIAARLGGPRVRALHLPPPTGTKEAEFCVLELDDGSIGFTFMQLEGTEEALRAHHAERDLAGEGAAALARGYADADPVTRALGFAAINALSQALFKRAGWIPSATVDPLGAIHPKPGEHIGMIGLFRSLVPEVLESGARLTVLELKADLAGEEGGMRVTLDPAELATCEKVVSTCTVMLNGTLNEVLAACRNARHFAIVGPTAGCVPDPLFERGVETLGGRRVVDRERFLAAFHAGSKWGGFAAKYVLSRADYPGVEALLARVP